MEDKKPRYVLMGNDIRSENDGDLHYISARRLAELYHLNPNDCIMFDMKTGLAEKELEAKKWERAGHIVLWPCSDGDYNLNHENQKTK